MNERQIIAISVLLAAGLLAVGISMGAKREDNGSSGEGATDSGQSAPEPGSGAHAEQPASDGGPTEEPIGAT